MSTLVITHTDTRFCDFLRKRFELHGHQIIRALDGVSCLARCREKRPDAVVVSLAFAGRDDFALMKELQSAHASVHRIIVADSADASDISDCKSLGCAFYIRRYVRSSSLLEEVEHVAKGQTSLAFVSEIPSFVSTPYALGSS